MTVIDDKRIQVSHVAHKNQWDLMIKDVKPEDDGVYECQISTKDRTVRRLVTLHVVGEIIVLIVLLLGLNTHLILNFLYLTRNIHMIPNFSLRV